MLIASSLGQSLAKRRRGRELAHHPDRTMVPSRAGMTFAGQAQGHGTRDDLAMSTALLSDVVLIEVPDPGLSALLAERLANRWRVTVDAARPDVVAVLVELRPVEQDLARLMRDVACWAKQEALGALRFELDGRGYVLEAGEVDWPADVAGVSAAASRGERLRLLRALETVDRAISQHRERSDPGSRIEGLETLREDIIFALRLNDESS
jgi:hypothetical protein